jgi:hypothetical protein
LLHGETLLVVATSDLENIALVFVAEDLAVDFLAHSSIVEGATKANAGG